MGSIYEIKTKSGKEFKVIAKNNSQEAKIFATVESSKGTAEEIISINNLMDGIQSTSNFLSIQTANIEEAKYKAEREQAKKTPPNRKLTSTCEIHHIANRGVIICGVITTHEVEYHIYNDKPYLYDLKEDTYFEIGSFNPLVRIRKENIAKWLKLTYKLVIPTRNNYIPFWENTKATITYICGNTDEDIFRAFYSKEQSLINCDTHSIQFVDESYSQVDEAYSKLYEDYVSLNSL